MEFDYSKLLGLIAERGYTRSAVADLIGMTASTFSQKVNNKFSFTQRDMYALKVLLNIEDMDAFFFTPKN